MSGEWDGGLQLNWRKWEDERRREADKAAAARRASDAQVKADALRLVAEWNERQTIFRNAS
jgi:hypothetical protein